MFFLSAMPGVLMRFRSVRHGGLSIDEWVVQEDESWVLLGRNGSGKRLLATLIMSGRQPEQGCIEALPATVQLLSFETQQAFYEHELYLDDTDFMDQLDPGTTVAELLALGDERPPLLRLLGLEPLLNRGYRLLSTGESRKALLARALLQEPALLILDEPYDGLDRQSRHELEQYFAAHAGQQGTGQLLFILNRMADISVWHSHVAVMERSEMIFSATRSAAQQNEALQALMAFDPDSLPPWPAVAQGHAATGVLPEPLLQLRRVTVSYGGSCIFSNLDLRVSAGQHTLITGRNGSGKSTLLALISGDHPQCYSNDIQVMGMQRGSGESIWDIKQHLGIVSPDLHRNHRVAGSALEIIISGFYDSIGLYEHPDPAALRVARQWLAMVGMEEKSGVAFRKLSYGEQRLVLIARAMVKQPPLLILDEPTQGLDDLNRHRVLYFLERLSSRQGTTLLFVSHRQDEHLPLFVQHLDMDAFS